MAAIKRTNATDYLLRNIPDELWSAVQAIALRDGLTLREVLLQLLDDYRNGKRLVHRK